MIPRFDSNGNLPPGIYHAQLTNVVKRFGGPGYGARLLRTNSLKSFVELASPYIEAIYVDGSYITTDLAPSDVDLAVVVRDDISRIPDGLNQLTLLQNMFKGDLHIFPFKKEMKSLTNMINYWMKDRDGHHKGIVYIEVKK